MGFTNLIVLVLLWIGASRGETCECVSYIITENGLSNENRITSTEYDLEDSRCDGDSVMTCMQFCVEMYKELTDNGKTCMIMPGDDRIVADWMCKALNRNVCNERVGIFAQSCGSDAVDTGFRFQETLCCENQKGIHC